MYKKSLNDFVTYLDNTNQLETVNEFVSPNLEIAEISERFMKHNNEKALLFKNNGTNFPVLINMMGSKSRMLNVLYSKNYEDVTQEVSILFNELKTDNKNLFNKIKFLPKIKKFLSYIPKKSKFKGECQQNIITEPNLKILPILKCWPHDGGEFVTLPMVVTQNPITKQRNVGMYRMQKLDDKSTGMHWHLHKGGAAHFNEYKKLGKKMPVSVVLGGDPVYTYCSTAPLPPGIDEFYMAGYLRKKKVKLVKSITNEIFVPTDADIVIEGYIDTSEDFILEGPFGDHTGFYSLDDYYPRFHVTCITHRNNAIYPATIVGVPPMEDAEISVATEKIFTFPLQVVLPEITKMHLPNIGVSHNLVLLNVETDYPGQASKVLNTILGTGQMMFSKYVVCLPNNIDIFDLKIVLNEIVQRVNPEKHIITSYGPTDVLDHASYEFAKSGKILIDATHEKQFDVKEIILSKKNTSEKSKEIIKNNILWCFADEDELLNYKTVSEFVENTYEFTTKPFAIIVTNLEFYNQDDNFLWYILFSNTDPKFDFVLKNNILIFDASVKTKQKNAFNRRWPNIVTMSEKVIQKIDNNWDKYKIGDFIESPSLNRLKMSKGEKEFFE